jgi:Zn finger protein HypA/HybF involved in hydrogenase expression
MLFQRLLIKVMIVNRAKISINYVKSELYKINQNIIINSPECNSAREKMELECVIDGYIWFAPWYTLKIGTGCPKCGGRVSPSIDDIKIELKEINKNILILSDSHKNSSTKLKCECLIDNHIWYAKWGNLKHGYGCPKCAGRVLKDIREIKNEIYKITNIIEIKTEKINKNTDKILCRCLIDGHEWSATYGNLKNGQGCPRCANNIKKTYDKAVEDVYFINKNIEIISKKYDGHNTPVECSCKKCGNVWNTRWSSLMSGTSCPLCANNMVSEKQRLGVAFIREELKKMNKGIFLLSEEYINSITKMKFKCDKHDTVWETSWGVLKNGVGCPICVSNVRHGKGSYSIKMAERNKSEWLSIKSQLYFIKCFNESEVFYKIGITTYNVKIRFKGIQMPYNYEVLSVFELNLYDAIYCESEIIKNNKCLKYIPKIKFGGYNECFSQMDISELNNVIHKERS